MMNPYEIGVETNEGLKTLLVKPVQKDTAIEYEIWEGAQQLFSLECCTDPVADSLKLTQGYASQFIDLNMVQAVADIIQSEEE